MSCFRDHGAGRQAPALDAATGRAAAWCLLRETRQESNTDSHHGRTAKDCIPWPCQSEDPAQQTSLIAANGKLSASLTELHRDPQRGHDPHAYGQVKILGPMQRRVWSQPLWLWCNENEMRGYVCSRLPRKSGPSELIICSKADVYSVHVLMLPCVHSGIVQQYAPRPAGLRVKR